jgi:excisionase family DNA binding protein
MIAKEHDQLELLTIAEAASLLKVAPITVRRFIAAGRLPAVRVGKSIRVRREALEQVITPVEPRKRKSRKRIPAGRPLTFDDPMWALVGSATSAAPTDASKKYEYLADALAPKQE